jgi:hypothetical protein
VLCRYKINRYLALGLFNACHFCVEDLAKISDLRTDVRSYVTGSREVSVFIWDLRSCGSSAKVGNVFSRVPYLRPVSHEHMRPSQGLVGLALQEFGVRHH